MPYKKKLLLIGVTVAVLWCGEVLIRRHYAAKPKYKYIVWLNRGMRESKDPIDAMMEGYNRGYRMFDVALEPAKGGKDFCDRTGKFCSEHVESFLQQIPDLMFAVEFKAKFNEGVTKFVSSWKTNRPNLLDRFVPQVTKEADLVALRKIHPFVSVFYAPTGTHAETLAFLQKHPEVVATIVEKKQFTPDFAKSVNQMGKVVYVHTVESHADIGQMLREGAAGFGAISRSPAYEPDDPSAKSPDDRS